MSSLNGIVKNGRMDRDDQVGERKPLLPGSNKMVDYDAALGYIGSFGTYQKLKFSLLLLMCIPVGIHMLATVFLGAQVSHHCAVPELAEAGLAPNDFCGLNYSLPWVTDKETNTETPSECKRYKVNRYELGNLSCPFERNSEGNRTVLDCDKGWWYDRQVYNSSVYMEFNLVCEDEPLNNLAQSLFMVGVLIGSIVFGQLSDSIGRKKTMYLAVLVQLGFGVATAFAPNYEVFVVLRLLVGFTAMGVFLPAFVVATEMVGVNRRTLTGTLIQSSFSMGGVVLTGIAYLIRDWSRLQLVISLINVVLVLTWWFGIESPRWQLSKGRNEEVVRMIRSAAKVNGVTVPDEVFHAGKKQVTESDKRQYTIFDIVRTPNMAKKSVIIFFNWFVVTVVWFGLALNTQQLGGDNYLNFLIMNLVDFPAQIFSIFTVSYFGRRPSLTFYMLFGGVACIVTPYLAPPFLPEYMHPLSVALPMVGKFGNTAAFSVIYVWTAELYPTVVRNVGVGASSMWSRVGGIVSPFVMLSQQVWGPLPYLIFGGLSILAGLSALLLPETRGVRLPDTLEEGENFGKRTPYVGYIPVPDEEKVPATAYSNPDLRNDDETVKEDTESVLPDKTAIQCSEDC
ncbi:organic cation transporter protein-like [Branchiostoma lanceolatum]|uniref:organic cation transporter protein-like n=1 Tax=Branchiostoma lanceolatum TaxID=7740 RepID=UPI0034541FC5